MQIMGHLIKMNSNTEFYRWKASRDFFVFTVDVTLLSWPPFTIFVLNLKKHANTITELGIDFLSVVLDYLQVLTFCWLIAL